MALGDMKDLQMQADGAYRCDGFFTDGKRMKNMVWLLHHLSRDIFSYLSLISLQVYVFWKLHEFSVAQTLKLRTKMESFQAMEGFWPSSPLFLVEQVDGSKTCRELTRHPT